MNLYRSPRGKVGEAGFSLIEMLVAISILALVLAMLPGTFSLAHRTWNAAAVLDHQARRDSANSFLQARLAEAMQIFEQEKSGAIRLVFSGSAEALSFVAPSANGPQGAGLYRFALEAKQGAAGRNALVVAIAPYIPVSARNGDAEAGEEHILQEGVTGVSFRYYGRKNLGSNAPAWQTEWTRQDALPDAVELSITSGKTVRTILVGLRLKSTS